MTIQEFWRNRSPMAIQPDSSRREFLTGKAGVRALQGAADAATGLSGEEGAPEMQRQGTLELPRSSDYLLAVSRRAMACTFEVHLPAATRGTGTEAGLAALDLVDDLESQLTVYRNTSEVIEINRWAARRAVEVEERLFDLLESAVRISGETAGAYDITSNPLSEVWGFSRRRGELPSPADLEAALSRVGYEQIVLERNTRCISFSRPGVTINLNSIGKGYALDRMEEQLCQQGFDRFLLHGGNSSVLGRVAGADDRPWRIGVRNPVRPTQRLGEVLIADRAVGTSGSGTQFFHHQGRRYGHILDPRTGYPAERVLSATVLADSGAEADALATAFYVMGPEHVSEYCQRHPETAAVLICPPGTGARVELHLFGAADEWWRPT
jgi:thiamine biosynthesis lipoprotein